MKIVDIGQARGAMITDIFVYKLTKILLKRAFSFGGSGFEEGIFGFYIQAFEEEYDLYTNTIG